MMKEFLEQLSLTGNNVVIVSDNAAMIHTDVERLSRLKGRKDEEGGVKEQRSKKDDQEQQQQGRASSGGLPVHHAHAESSPQQRRGRPLGKRFVEGGPFDCSCSPTSVMKNFDGGNRRGGEGQPAAGPYPQRRMIVPNCREEDEAYINPQSGRASTPSRQSRGKEGTQDHSSARIFSTQRPPARLLSSHHSYFQNERSQREHVESRWSASPPSSPTNNSKIQHHHRHHFSSSSGRRDRRKKFASNSYWPGGGH